MVIGKATALPLDKAREIAAQPATGRPRCQSVQGAGVWLDFPPCHQPLHRLPNQAGDERNRQKNQDR
jgi:hypothetical protein